MFLNHHYFDSYEEILITKSTRTVSKSPSQAPVPIEAHFDGLILIFIDRFASPM